MALDAGVSNRPPRVRGRKVKIPTKTVAARELPNVRIARLGPLYFSSDPGNRYSTPRIPEGMLYLGQNGETCFWEVFWDSLTAARGKLLIPKKRLLERKIYQAKFKRPMKVFQAIDSAHLKLIGANNVGCFNGDYDVCREWAAYLYELEPALDGIIFPSARSVRRNLALFGGRVKPDDVEFERTGTPLLNDESIRDLLATNRVYYGRT